MPRTLLGFACAFAVLSAAAPCFADDPPPAGETAPAAKPAPKEALPKETAPIPSTDERVLYAVGLRVRYLTVPGWLLAPFLDQHTSLNSASLAGEFVRRKGNLDITVSLDLGFYSPTDGNYLGSGKNPNLDTHYVQFRNLDFLSLDVSFYWVHDFLPWLALTLGGGVGIGIVFGDVFVVNNSQTVCNAANAGDPNSCYPVGPAGPVKPTDPQFQQKLEALKSGNDTAQSPNYHSSSDKPPVMVVVNFAIGLRFKVHRHFAVNVGGGFRDGWVLGAGPEYVF
jgi:hypothetical protein